MVKQFIKPVIPVSYGIASSYDDCIEIHRCLTGELRERVLAHERKHDSNNKYTKGDFVNDFNSSNSFFKDTFIFALKYPSALVNFFPIMWSYYYKEMTFNWSATIPFLYFGAIFSVFWWLIFKVSILNSFICYIIVVAILNLILMAIAHIIVKKSGFEY
jgi:hypothetical protein